VKPWETGKTPFLGYECNIGILMAFMELEHLIYDFTSRKKTVE